MGLMLEPVGFVEGGRIEPDDDDWEGVEAVIALDETRFGPEALWGLDSFSHVEVIYAFHKADPEKIVTGARHPRGRTDWPKVGIFAQRGHSRPNHLGVTMAHVVQVDGTRLTVRGLDAIDGTPVLDLKPVLSGFQPRGAFREPDWAREIMADYWKKG